MRIVRYSHLADQSKAVVPFSDPDAADETEEMPFDSDDDWGEEPDYASQGYWPLVDELVYPLTEAPYLSVDKDGVYRPENIQMQPYKLAEARLLAPVTPSKIACRAQLRRARRRTGQRSPQ